MYMRQWECLFGSGFMCVRPCLEMKKRTLSLSWLYPCSETSADWFFTLYEISCLPFSSYVHVYMTCSCSSLSSHPAALVASFMSYRENAKRMREGRERELRGPETQSVW